MTKNHVKPEKEELEANALKALEEAEALKEKEEEHKEEEPKKEDEQEKQEEEHKEEEHKEEDKKPADKEEDDKYRKKFIASSKEAIILDSANKKITSAIEQANEIADPTDEEMKAKHADYDDMTPTEQRLAKANYKMEKKFDLIFKGSQEGKEMKEWSKKVDDYITDPKTLADIPELEGKEDEFKIFALKETRRGIPFEDLTKAFLFDATKATPSHKGEKMFDVGGGGEKLKEKPKSDKITQEQAKLLRESDYPKYKEYLLAGKIEEIEL